jgi:hypothetical protein
MQCGGKREGRWGTSALCGLLAVLWALCALDVGAVSIKVTIPEKDEPWPWRPQLDLAVPSSFFSGERVLSEVDHWRVLSYVGAPLRVSADNVFDLMQVLELMQFMRADDKGQCPCYATPHRVFYYWFHPEELELLYGEPRWEALQKLQEPKAWSLVLTDDVGPAVRSAENFIAQLKAVDPPGQLILHMKSTPAEMREGRVPLADFRVFVRVISAGPAMVYRMPQLKVDGEAVGRRQHIHHFLQVKRKLGARVAEFDASTARAQRSLYDSLMELRQAEQDAYDRQVQFKERYRSFLLERQARQAAGEKEDSSDSGEDHTQSGARRSQSWLVIRSAAPPAPTAKERHAVLCRKISAAWQTLQESGVRWETDRRALQLRRLHARHCCPADLPQLQGMLNKDTAEEEWVNAEATATAAGELSDAARQQWVASVAEMMAQRDQSGRPPTFAQLFAVLFAVWEAEMQAAATAADVNSSNSAEGVTGVFNRSGSVDGTPAAADGDGSFHVKFNPTDFVSFADRFVESGCAVAMAGGWLPRFIRAELHYVVGIMDLVTHQQSCNNGSRDDTTNTTSPSFSGLLNKTGTTAAERQHCCCGSADGVVRGVLHLHESLSAGSDHAAGALATLREHGIFVRQHAKAATLLLLRSMRSAPSHLLRELLLTPRRAADESAARSTKSLASSPTRQRHDAVERPPNASRLLRFEQFYAVDHTFREVDDPFMTREGVTTLVAVSSENIYSTDDAPELEDVYREAEVERHDDDHDNRITNRLSRRVLKANMLFSGFKGSRRDPHEAQCELLVVLRHLGYFCDLDQRWVLSEARAGSGRRRHSRPVTLVGLPLPYSCPEHDRELYNVLDDRHHTLLMCPSGRRADFHGADSILPLGHPVHSVPTSETLFAMLHQVLLSLSYVHLIHTQQYELSHMYATLSVEMSLRLQQQLLREFQHKAKMLEYISVVVNVEYNGSVAANTKKTTFTWSQYDVLKGIADSSGEVGWAADVLLEEMEGGPEGNETVQKANTSFSTLNTRVVDAVQRCRSIADSPFVNTEALLLLALSRWAPRDPLVGNTVTSAAVEKPLAQWAMEPFRLLSELVLPTDVEQATPTNITVAPGQTQEERLSRESNEDEVQGLKPAKGTGRNKESSFTSNITDAGAGHTKAVDVHALFLVCLAAMKRWKNDFPSVHLLDSTTFSVRRTDPFVLASFLLHTQDVVTGEPIISIPRLREMAFAATPHFLGQTPHFLPMVDDTVESYAARLLRFAARHIHALEPSAELLRSGSYGVGALVDNTVSPSSQPSSATAAVNVRRRRVFDDAPPRRFRLRTLRQVKQQTFEMADLQPLLYAADLHDYLSPSRWTYLGTSLNAVYSALQYPFTLMTSEKVLGEMEERLQFTTPEERAEHLRRFLVFNEEAETEAEGEASGSSHGAGEAEAESVEGQQPLPTSPPDSHGALMTGVDGEGTAVTPFVDAFAKDVHLREHFIACQLFSFTLESGMPEGFSLIFLEAADHHNAFLRTLADYFADSVFGPWTASVWTEHHLSAQWQREKRDQTMDGSALTLSARSPFRYASLEGRQELFARLSRWKAARAATSPRTTRPRDLRTARDELLWCSGLLTRRAYYDSGRIYPLAYEGSVYPAADLECVAELNTFITAEGLSASRPPGRRAAWTTWTKAQWRQAQKNGTALLRDLGDRLAYDYDLIEDLPARRLPLSESDFHPNSLKLKAAAKLADHPHAHRKRFIRASTQLVEPWNRRSREISAESLGYGEGTYYNSRLHRVSGHRWGSMVQSWWLWLRSFFP